MLKGNELVQTSMTLLYILQVVAPEQRVGEAAIRSTRRNRLSEPRKASINFRHHVSSTIVVKVCLRGGKILRRLEEELEDSPERRAYEDRVHERDLSTRGQVTSDHIRQRLRMSHKYQSCSFCFAMSRGPEKH